MRARREVGQGPGQRNAPAASAGASLTREPRYWTFAVIQSYTAGTSVRWFSEVIRPQRLPS